MNSSATAFSDCCEECLGSPDVYGGSIGHRAAAVQGTMRAEVDVAFTTCRRGHRIVVRRAVRAPLPTTFVAAAAVPGPA